MKRLWIIIYDKTTEADECLEAVPFDEREEEEEINENKTCFFQKVQYHGYDCLKIKVDCGYSVEIRYYPVDVFSIQQVEIFE